ncbi:putative membrane protein domain-containing protein [Ditylenchus destructor]|uniref:Membrane protein domain-containing protein n=1 Tax=Ditylenchus destructor TaxID=166010 RepID=A0AAD4N9X2_9BILA|nr:putative membrane protein domain-containing protein [Ditylenchus destructor]
MGAAKRETLSSIGLQMALHYHLYLAPFTILCQILCFVLKYEYLHPTYRVILLAIHLIFIVVEIVRPCLGYYGNLGEKIPSLTGYWITSIILQIPICIFLTANPDIWPLPLERFAYIVNLLFLIVEVITVTRLLKLLAKTKTKKFKESLMEDEIDVVGAKKTE